MSEQRLSERSIFEAAIEIASLEERAAYLDQVCSSDVGLRQEIEALLAAHQRLREISLSGPAANLDVTTDDPISERPGTVIGSYKLMEQIGEGGMGLVFVAEQQQPVRRKVALKVIKPGMDTRHVIARFEAERQALALMDHPNIARVFDGGVTSSGRPYFVMELIKGVPIIDYCDHHQLSIRQRLELFVDVCQAVQHAHQKGIIHRDIKPSNVLVMLQDGTSVVKVIDFGVAKAIGQQLTDKTIYTQFTQMVGTPLYMSPEQAGLSCMDVDTRCDIYALGVLLYQLLTGTTPFDKERLRTMGYDEMCRIIREEEPPKPSTRISTLGQAATAVSTQRQSEPKQLRRLIRGELDWIVMKALEKDRNRRYETANGLNRDVQRYLADEPVLACPPSALYRFRKLARRNKGILLSGSVIALAVAAAVVALAVSNVRISDEKQQKDIALLERSAALEAAQQSEQDAKANERLARRRFYDAQMNLAQQAWDAGNPARVLELLEGQRPRFDEEDLRGFEWYHLWRRCHSSRRLRLAGHSSPVHAVAFSPDGTMLASGDFDGNVKLWDAATGQERPSPPGHQRWVTSLAFAPNGPWLVSAGNDGLIQIYDTKTAQVRATFRRPSYVRSLAFSPDGGTLAAGRENGSVEFWDLATGQGRLLAEAHTGSVLALAFTRDGKMLATGTSWGDACVKFWDLTRQPERLVDRWATPGGALAFTPDGKRLASFVNGSALVQLREVPTGQVRAERSLGFLAFSLAFSPDGKTLAVGVEERHAVLWDTRTGQERALPHRAQVLALAYSPGGATLATGSQDGSVQVWDTALREEPITLLHSASVRTVGFPEAGKRLISASSDGDLRVWDLASTLESARFSLPAHRGDVMALDPSGVLVASASAERRPGNGDVRLRDVKTGQEKAVLRGDAHGVPYLVFAPDGKTLATGGWDAPARLWDVSTGRVRAVLTGLPSVISLAYSPDNKLLAVGCQFGIVWLYDARTGRPRSQLQDRTGAWNNIHGMEFSPDGRVLATAETAGTIKLWDPASGQLRASLKGHTGWVPKLCFFPDGQTLASAGDDTTVRLWDVATGQERVTLKGHKDHVFCLAIAADGHTLASASGDGTVKLWRAATDAQAQARATELDPEDADSPLAQERHGDELWATGRPAEAESAYGTAANRWEQLAVAFPHRMEYQQRRDTMRLKLHVVRAGTASDGEAERAYQRLLDIEPVNLAELHNLVWVLITSPNPHGSSARWSVGLARRLVGLAPRKANYWRTLGLAYYRAGAFEAAAAALQRPRELEFVDSAARFALALVHGRLGHREEATRWYRDGLAKMEDEEDDRDVRGLRNEAAELLEVERKSDNPPFAK